MKSSRFPIDDHINFFTIEVKGVYQSDINLIHRDGTAETFSSYSTTIDNIGVAIVITVKTPIMGTWELQSSAGITSGVIVKGKGRIDFTSQLLKKVGGIPYPIPDSSPVTGSNMTVGLTVKDIAETDLVDTIILRSKTDAILKKQNVTSNDRHSPRVISADFEVPLEFLAISNNNSGN